MNVIYAITCTRSEKNYTMETKRRLADRLTEHLRSIKINFTGLPVTAHFSSSEHSILTLMYLLYLVVLMTLIERQKKNVIFIIMEPWNQGV